ncbi:DUF2493 domain-containing protein [Sphingomonas sp. RB3P16]|uniref:DUF2493 domain-containing protein n=1 Tax=Parasphingomonas frigoris TaxID=3096163 RepID=UPI002FC8DE4C
MRVVVTGGRDYRDQKRVAEALNTIHAERPIEVLIHGAATGADTLAAEWAWQRKIPVEPYPAAWDDITAMPCRIRYKGRKPYNALAGHARNIRMLMLSAPTLVVAFPGGAGTAHCRAQALRRGIAVMDVDA